MQWEYRGRTVKKQDEREVGEGKNESGNVGLVKLLQQQTLPDDVPPPTQRILRSQPTHYSRCAVASSA